MVLFSLFLFFLFSIVAVCVIFCLVMVIRYWNRGEKWMSVAYVLSLAFMSWVVFLVHSVDVVKKELKAEEHNKAISSSVEKK